MDNQELARRFCEKMKGSPLKIITYESPVEYIYDREPITANGEALQSIEEKLTALKARLIVEDIPCLKCSVPMVLGKAIKGYQYVEGITTDDTGVVPAHLIDCLKCPACGYSESIDPTPSDE